ncbi:transcription factor-like protein [Angomonas deanei]|uniref:FACT complex subunit n=1 Tax=Angomonas deanei TaxID=59799 RepID=A0A7G2CLQ3_9TRYP|nr:transcription factor-like protein [Angomonas deanei]CAD2220778.1 Metallopeptidase family M24/FACT complex subunit (SPT16/CDC68)/Histone chaperone Rttp106-like, putative [Angomonas deanei]|eukprot:EPY28133.1 transcription factor-like protein [Angomonas deanei]
MSLTIVNSRIHDLLQTWSASKAAGDAAATGSDVLFLLCGTWTEETMENQRGQAVIQYVLDATRYLSNVALFLAEGKALVVYKEEEGRTVAEGTPVDGLQVTLLRAADNAEEVAAAITSFIGNGKLGSASATQELPLQVGPFAEEVLTTVRRIAQTNSGGDPANVSQLLGELLFVKDADGVRDLQRAAAVCGRVFKEWVSPTLTTEMIKTAPQTLAALREELVAVMSDPASIGLGESPHAAGFAPSLALTPCIFHQGVYLSDLQVQDLQQLNSLTSVPLQPGVVLVRYAMKNKCNTAFISRTMLLESKAPEGAKETYEFVYAISEFVKDSLTVGTRLQDVYTKTMAHAQQVNPQLAALLPKSFGFSTGLLILQQRGMIGEKGTAVVANGMSFVVRVVLEKIPTADGSTYDMELGDTVLVEDGVATVCTKKYRTIDEVVFDVEETKGVEDIIANKQFGTRSKVSGTVIVSGEEQREIRLREIAADNLKNYVKVGHVAAVEADTVRLTELGRLALGELTPYPLPQGSTPPEEAKRGIYVDTQRFLVWFPLMGRPTPFHVATISKVEVQHVGEEYVGLFELFGTTKSNVSFKVHPNCVFLRNLRYTDRTDSFSSIKAAIDDLVKAIRAKDASRKKSTVATASGTLKRSAQPVLLRNVKVRPPIKSVGSLELHENGFRYAYSGAPAEILFDNIEHAVFQPSFGQSMVIFHLTLKKPIVLNGKNTSMVQFYADVLETSELATTVKRGYEDEMREEERTSELIRRTNNQFLNFCRSAEAKMGRAVQMPLKGFSFDGVHARGTATFHSSIDRKLLYSVNEWPAFTLNVEDVELVSFERVFALTKTVDITFVFKNYHTPVVRINSIPADRLNDIKDWCLDANLYYTLSSENPRWTEVLKEILSDPEWNPWDAEGGWSIWNEDSVAGEEDEEEDSDSSYEEDEDEEEDSDSSWEEDEESASSSGSDDSDDSEESSGEDWDELERKAEAQDRKRGRDENEDDAPRRRAPPPQRRPDNAPSRSGPVKTPMKAPMFGKSVPPPRRF